MHINNSHSQFSNFLPQLPPNPLFIVIPLDWSAQNTRSGNNQVLNELLLNCCSCCCWIVSCSSQQHQQQVTISIFVCPLPSLLLLPSSLSICLSVYLSAHRCLSRCSLLISITIIITIHRVSFSFFLLFFFCWSVFCLQALWQRQQRTS